MKNCNDYMELLSAYADGELIGSDKNRIEYHLAECESCSALLEVYREISISVNETCVDAQDAPNAPNVPEALCIAVMNRVKNENMVSAADYIKTDKVKQRKKYSKFLTRYAPIAAGLAVMLLIWQFWGNLFGVDNAMVNQAMPETAMPALAPDEYMVAAPADYAPEAEAGGVDDSAWDADEYIDVQPDDELPDRGANDGGDADMPVAESVPCDIADYEDDIIRRQERTEEETEQIMELISGAYAEIAFSGRLPAFLEKYEPLPFGSWDRWQLVFEIPSAEVPTLLTELDNREGLMVLYNEENSDSEYAIVLFSPG